VAHTVPTIISAARVTEETLKIKILLIIFLPFKKQNALRARLRPLKASGCPDSPSIVPEVGCRALIAPFSYVQWLQEVVGGLSIAHGARGVKRWGLTSTTPVSPPSPSLPGPAASNRSQPPYPEPIHT